MDLGENQYERPLVAGGGEGGAGRGETGGVEGELVARLAELCRGRRVLAVTGAGVSTDCGIPDYRGTGLADRPTVDLEQFLSQSYWRSWVWERNHATWRTFDSLQPNAGHLALARLEGAGIVSGVATQNVDGLHTKAGSKNVWELHGVYSKVQCLECGEVFSRESLDAEFARLNPGAARDDDPAHVAVLALAEEEKARASTFIPASCPLCGGLIKPGIVFFGEGLPGEAMDGALWAARHCEVCLVAGTSLLVSTGMWMVQAAVARGAALAIINRGPTAADARADLRIEGGTSEYLEAVAQALIPPA